MIFKNAFRQLLRRPVLLIVYGLIAALITSVLCIGFVLTDSYSKASRDLDNAYRTIAVPTVYSQVPASTDYYAIRAMLDSGTVSLKAYEEAYEKGSELYSFPLDGDSIRYTGRTENSVSQLKNLDLTAFLSSEYVTSVDIRRRYGAYIEGLEKPRELLYADLKRNDVLIFTPDIDDVLVLTPDDTVDSCYQLPVTVEYSMQADESGYYSFYDLDCIPVKVVYSDSRDRLVFEPGKTYIALCTEYYELDYWDKGSERMISMPMSTKHYYTCYIVSSGSDSIAGIKDNSIELICEYTDDFFKSERGVQFKEYVDALNISLQSAAVMTTSDINMIRAFHSEKLYAREGRLFTDEEQASGAKICLVSYDLAKLNGWAVGDRIPVSLYETDSFTCNSYSYNGDVSFNYYTAFDPGSVFFTEDEFEIVGLYDGEGLFNGKALFSLPGQEKESQGKDILLNSDVIFIPEASINNLPSDYLASSITVSFLLRNGTIDLFLDEMEDKGGLNGSNYEIGLTFYDQGYSRAAVIADNLKNTGRTMVIVSCLVALITTLLFSYLYVTSRSREMAVMRSLGVSTSAVRRTIALCMIVVLLIAAFMGCAIALGLIDKVCDVLIYDKSAAVSGIFSSAYGQDIDKSLNAIVQCRPISFISALAYVFAVNVIVIYVFIIKELSKSPLQMIPRGGKR